MKYGAFMGNKFLSGDDFEDEEEKVLTIAKAMRVKAKKPPKFEEEVAPCLKFEETEQRLILNKTNGRLVKKICGSRDTKDWPGHKITVYFDKTVTFGPEVVGGIRVKDTK